MSKRQISDVRGANKKEREFHKWWQRRQQERNEKAAKEQQTDKQGGAR
jgi:hypothetical protein